jgi:hypothetical protein
MESLRKALQQYAAGASVMLGAHGAKQSGRESQPANREALALQQALSDLSRRNEKYFIIGVACCLSR